MELPKAVNGYIRDWIATNLSWEKLEAFGDSIGVDTSFFQEKRQNDNPKYDPNFRKRTAANYIMRSTTEDGEIILITLMRKAENATFDNDQREELMNEINPLLERTIQGDIDIDGNINYIFNDLHGLETQLPLKLKELGFDTEAENYKNAYITYTGNRKGAIATVRTVFQGVVETILEKHNANQTTNMKDHLSRLKNLGILKETGIPDRCPDCGIDNGDLELNGAYNLYQQLSYYGSHPAELTDETADYLFSSTTSLINLLITRNDILTP
jgi:hypothetical protein